jgi:hypothetical protein
LGHQAWPRPIALFPKYAASTAQNCKLERPPLLAEGQKHRSAKDKDKTDQVTEVKSNQLAQIKPQFPDEITKLKFIEDQRRTALMLQK